MGFGEKLKAARERRGFTQQYVADQMGLDKSTYCGYETGKRNPDVQKVKRLSSILGTSADELLETGFGGDSPDMGVRYEHSLGVSNIARLLEKELSAPISEDGLAEFIEIFRQLSPDNRAKLLELSHLYLDAQSKTAETK